MGAQQPSVRVSLPREWHRWRDGIQRAGGASQLADGAAAQRWYDPAGRRYGQLADGGSAFADGGHSWPMAPASSPMDLPRARTRSRPTAILDRQNLSRWSPPVATGNLLGTATVGTGWATALMVLALWAGAMATCSGAGAEQLLPSSARPSAYLVAEAMLPGVIVVGIQVWLSPRSTSRWSAVRHADGLLITPSSGLLRRSTMRWSHGSAAPDDLFCQGLVIAGHGADDHQCDNGVFATARAIPMAPPWTRCAP